MKNFYFKLLIATLSIGGILLVGQSWSQFANLVISETYYDGTDEWILIRNIGNLNFSGTMAISGASSQTIRRNLTIGAGSGLLLCDQCAMISGTQNTQTGLGLSLSDTIPWSISLWLEGQKIDEFTPGVLIGQLNDKKQSIVKYSTGYSGGFGKGCIEGYFCDLLYSQNTTTSSNSLRLVGVYGGDECVGEFLKFEATNEFSGFVSIEDKTRYVGKISSGDIILFSNQSGRSSEFIYGYTGNIVQSKGGVLHAKINNQNINYSFGELITGMMKISGSGDMIYHLGEDSPVDIDSSCNTSSISEITSCGEIDMSGSYLGGIRRITGIINNKSCNNLIRTRGNETGSGCLLNLSQPLYQLNKLHIEGINEGRQCEHDVIVTNQGTVITGQRNTIQQEQNVAENLIKDQTCSLVIQETQPFYAGQGFNVAIEFRGKLISGTGCAIQRGNEILTNKCNPSSITILTGGLGRLSGSVTIQGIEYKCSLLLNLPKQTNTQSIYPEGENKENNENDMSYFDKLISGLSKRGLWFNKDKSVIDIKKIGDIGVDVGIPQQTSLSSGELWIEYINPKTDGTTDSEIVVIKHLHEFGQNISGYFLVYKNKRYDLGGFWSAGRSKTLAKKWGFNNFSGCVYLTTKEEVFQTYCRNSASTKEITKKVESDKPTKQKQSGEKNDYDYTKLQCETEKDLIEYGYRDYIKQLQEEKKISKKKKNTVGSKKQSSKKVQVKKPKKYSKIEQELKLYRGFVTILLGVINKYWIGAYENDDFNFIHEQFNKYKQQIAQSRGGAQIYTGNTLQQSFKGYSNPDPYSQLKDLLQ